MTGVELTSREAEILDRALEGDGCIGFYNDHTATIAAVSQIVAARLAPVEARIDGMQESVAKFRRERNVLRNEVARLTRERDEALAENRRLRGIEVHIAGLVRDGAYYPDQCCAGYCVADVHDLRDDQAERLLEVFRAALASASSEDGADRG